MKSIYIYIYLMLVWTSQNNSPNRVEVLLSVHFFLPLTILPFTELLMSLPVSFSDCTSAQLLHIHFSNPLTEHDFCSCHVLPVPTSCVSLSLTAFVVSSSASVARAEECIWWSYPGCPWATRDAEKEEMLYILKWWNSSSHLCPFLTLWTCCYSNLSYTHRLSKQEVYCWEQCPNWL